MDQTAMIGKVLGETNRVVDGIEPNQLDNPSPCDEWTVRDVLNHVIGGARMFAVCVRDGSISDEEFGAIAAGDNLGDDYKAALRTATDDALGAFAAPGAVDKMVTLPFGTMPAGVAMNIAIFDVATHTWDLARATGEDETLDPEQLQRMIARIGAMPEEALRAEGMFGPPIKVSADADDQTKRLAYFGRQA